MPARAAISSLVDGTSTAAPPVPARPAALGYRGHLPPQPLHRGQGRARQPVGAQARHGDEDRPADGELARHLALGGLVRLERYGRDGDPARVAAQRRGGDPRAFLVHRPRHGDPAVPGLAQLIPGDQRGGPGVAAAAPDMPGRVEDLDHVVTGQQGRPGCPVPAVPPPPAGR